MDQDPPSPSIARTTTTLVVAILDRVLPYKSSELANSLAQASQRLPCSRGRVLVRKLEGLVVFQRRRGQP